MSKKKKRHAPKISAESLRIMDNMLLPVFFESGSEEARIALQAVLRGFLNDPGLVVERFQTEFFLSNSGHRGVRVDVWAKDAEGRQIALELQRIVTKDIYPRAVYEASTMVVHALASGQSYADVEKVFVIFFLEGDIEGEDEPLYLYEVTRNGMTGIITRTAPSYIFVNGDHKDVSTATGRPIAYILQPDPKLMLTPELRRRMEMLKNSQEGQKKVEDALRAYDAFVREQAEENEALRRQVAEANQKHKKAKQKCKESDRKRKESDLRLKTTLQDMFQNDRISLEDAARLLNVKEGKAKKILAR